MQNFCFQKREPLVFRQFSRKGYALFACLGREVVISVLSVATLGASTASADNHHEAFAADSAATSYGREVLLDDVSVTGTRAPLALSQAARMVTVLDRDDIQAAPVQSVNDLLKMAVGVDVRQRGPLGMQTDLSIRGGTAEQIVILLNGINICDPQTAHNVMDLPVALSEIVRVEVLEGPAGRAYGSSSLVGAINIVTRPSRRSSADVRIEGGSYGLLHAEGRVNSAVGRWNNQLSGSILRSDGYTRSSAGKLNMDCLSAKAFYQGEYDDETVRLSWHVGYADKGWGSSTFYATPKWQADEQYEHTAKLFTAIQGETKRGPVHFRSSIYFNQFRDRYESYRDNPERSPFNYNRCDIYGVNLHTYFDWLCGRTAFGAELRNEDLVSGNLGEPLSRPHPIHGTDRSYTLGLNRTNISAFAEHNVLLKRFSLSAGFIAMKSSLSDMHMSIYPGVDISWRPFDAWKLFASYNSSLRLPSFTEMYYKLQGYAADPHLKPEKMQALELGAQYHTKGIEAKASVYRHYGRQMIDWMMDTSLGEEATWQSVNHTKINATGVEAGVTLLLNNLLPRQHVLQRLALSYGYIHQNKDLPEHIVSQYALEYLRHKFTASLTAHIVSRLNLHAYWHWQDREGAYTNFKGEKKSYRPYGLLDAKLVWSAPHYQIFAEGHNLLAKRDYVDYGNVEQPGFNIVAGISFQF